MWSITIVVADKTIVIDKVIAVDEAIVIDEVILMAIVADKGKANKAIWLCRCCLYSLTKYFATFAGALWSSLISICKCLGSG